LIQVFWFIYTLEGDRIQYLAIPLEIKSLRQE